MKTIRLTIISAFIMFANFTFAQTGTSKYQIADKIHLEGDGGWDYLNLDDATSRLFISHANVVQVLDINTKKLVGTIHDTNGVHGIALAPEFNKGFISCEKDTSVVVFDMKTLSVIAKFKTSGPKPDAILYDPFSKKVFVFNRFGSSTDVIDPSSNNVIKTIQLPGKPEFSVTDFKGRVYVNLDNKNLLCALNTAKLEVDQSWSVLPGLKPSGLAIDLVNNRLFSVCDNKLMVVVNATDGKVVSQVEIGEGVDGVSFDPQLKRAYSSNGGDGSITVVQQIDANNYKVIENIKVPEGAETNLLDTKTHTIYLPTAEFGEVPAATEANPHPRAPIKSNTFMVLEVKPL